MSTEIYYFSGTGNSLHAAKELQKRIPEARLIPMAGLKDKDAAVSYAEAVGFVFPIHFATVPIFIRSMINKLNLNSARYIFAVATRCGTPCSTAFTKINNVLKKKGKSLDSYLILNMASNDSKFDNWHDVTKEELADFEAELQRRLDLFQNVILNKEKFADKDSKVLYPINIIFERLGAVMSDARGYAGDDLYSDSKCSGCGICEKVCLSGKIRMEEQKPAWPKQSQCYFCYACINYCPMHSIQIRSNPMLKVHTEENGRYFHPEITADEIARQKLLL